MNLSQLRLHDELPSQNKKVQMVQTQLTGPWPAVLGVANRVVMSSLTW